MRLFSLRLTHKITAIGIVGVIGVVLIGGIHLYGERAMGVYRDAAEHARTVHDQMHRIEMDFHGEAQEDTRPFHFATGVTTLVYRL